MPASTDMFKEPRLLLVDDDPDTTDLIAHYMRENQVIIQSASDGQQALDAIDTFNPDLIVSDIKMAGMSGDKMLVALHQRGFSRPVLFLTGFEDLSMVLKSYEYDLLGFLQKPIDPDVLVAVVRRFLRLEYRRRLAGETIHQLSMITASCLPDETQEGLVKKAEAVARAALDKGH